MRVFPSLRFGFLLVLGSLLVPAAAMAGGFEYPGLGTKPLGRGGASFAGADDPMALHYNPSNLAVMDGTQLMLDMSLSFYDACYTRASSPSNTYGDDTNTRDLPPTDANSSNNGINGTIFEGNDFSGTRWPTVCNDAIPTPLPVLGFTHRLTREIGIGAGLLVPSSIAFSQWGDKDGTVNVGGQELPAPTRYQLITSEILFIQPSIGIGWAPSPMFRFGATLQWGLAWVNFVNNTERVGAFPEKPVGDVLTELKVKDLFVPGLILAATVTPIEALDVMVRFRWEDAVRASGDINFETSTYGTGTNRENPEAPVPVKTKISDVTFEAPLPWSLTLGVRYADRIAPKAKPAEGTSVTVNGDVAPKNDKLTTERWDIEVAVSFEHNSTMDAFRIGVPAGQIGLALPDLNMPIDPQGKYVIPHQWKDQLTVNLGGDYNIVPGLAALRLGLSYETDGVTRKYAQLDYIPTTRFGVHGGATLRLGQFDISVAYAHFFQRTMETAPSEAGLLPLAPLGTTTPTNAGTYESNIDVISLGATWHL